jgi:mercuric ion transport protein
VLLPALVVFLVLTTYGLWRRQRAAACCATETQAKRENS